MSGPQTELLATAESSADQIDAPEPRVTDEPAILQTKEELGVADGQLLEEFNGRVRVRIGLREDAVPHETRLHPATYWLAHDIAVLHGVQYDRYFGARIGRGTAYADAEDARQEALLGLMESFQYNPPDLERYGGAMALAHGIAAHKISDHYRKKERTRADPVDELPERRSDRRPVEDIVVGKLADIKALRKAIQTLTPRQRQIIGLIAPDISLTGEELGAELSLEPIAARVAKSRALAALRARMAPAIEEGIDVYAAKPAPKKTSKVAKAAPKKSRQPRPRRSSNEPPADLDTTQQEVVGAQTRKTTSPSLKVSVDSIRQKAAMRLREAHARGERELTAVIPEYLGPLLIAGQDISWHLHRADASEQALVVYPYANLRETLVEHMAAGMRASTLSRIHIVSPDRALALPARSNFEYVLGVGNIGEEAAARIRRISYFFLQLYTNLSDAANAHASRTTRDVQNRSRLAISNLYEAPPHNRRLSRRLEWTPADSANYLKEYRLMHGMQLTPDEAQRRVGRRIGSSVEWLKNGASADLREQAGYSIS